MNQRAQAAVDHYIRSLEEQLKSLPRERRQEILHEIRDHVDEASAQLGSESEADIRTLLDQLGEPSEIATEARQRFGIPAAKFGIRETGALILLPLGAILIPILGWFIGVILLWTSGAWTRKEKILGTLLPPGGLGGLIILFVTAGTSERSCTSIVDLQTGARHESCTGGGVAGLEQVLLIVLFGILIAAAIAIPIWLGLRLRRRT